MTRPGIHNLLSRSLSRISGKRTALLSHQPAINTEGTTTAELLARHPKVKLQCLLGPEHGYFGEGGAGQKVKSFRHPQLNIPVHSLYGAHRKPSTTMLKDVEVLVIDLCDLGIRTYTYVSTMIYCLEAAAELGIPVVVCDRPIPQPSMVDGPMLTPGYKSFVGMIETPMVYGMTPGETAKWFNETHSLNLDLHICRMTNYCREDCRIFDSPQWIPPSPAIRSWASSLCYAATVFTEAFEDIDCNRHGAMPFQVLGAPWMNGAVLSDALNRKDLKGVSFHPFYYLSNTHKKNVHGVRLSVNDPLKFRPIECSLHLLGEIMNANSPSTRWSSKRVRPDFFDKLYGTQEIRHHLKDSLAARTIIDSWQPALRDFNKCRKAHLLYTDKG